MICAALLLGAVTQLTRGESVVEVVTSNVAGVSGGLSVSGNALACNDNASVARVNLANFLPTTPITIRFTFTPQFLLGAGIVSGSKLTSYEIAAFASITNSPPSLALTRSVLELQVNNLMQFVATSTVAVPIRRLRSALDPLAHWADVQPAGDGKVVTLVNSSSPFSLIVTLTFTLMESTAVTTFLEIDCCHLRVHYSLPEPTVPPTPAPSPPRATPTTRVPTTAPITTATSKPPGTTTTLPPTPIPTIPTTTTTPSSPTTSNAKPGTPATTKSTQTTRTQTTATPTAGVISGEVGSGMMLSEPTESTTTTLTMTTMTSSSSASTMTVLSGAQGMLEPSDNVGLYVGSGVGACLLMSCIVALIVAMVVRKRKREARRPVEIDDGDELSARPMTPKYSVLPTTSDIAPVIATQQYGVAPRGTDEEHYVHGDFASA
jgi:hypothetical protein